MASMLTNCERCQGDLGGVFIMSWFTEETICGACHDKERPIKEALMAKGYTDAMEGCGHIPKPEKLKPNR